MSHVGIDDIAIHVPRLYLDIRDFAALRDQSFGKLNKGLGLAGMAIPDVHEDTATMGANAVARLIDRNGLDPRRIGRIYLGTESALDGAKPTATYVLEMLQARYGAEHGADCFSHCDVVDLTFACIGAVDALHNTLDWVARGGQEQDRIGIVVFSDNAKYELHSSGEYTQGAGGGAILVRHQPRLLAIPDAWGVSTNPVHDFFKPRREVAVRDVVSDVLALARETGAVLPEGLVDAMMLRLPRSEVARQGVFAHGHDTLTLHKDTPVFDGPFSNRCYREAVKQAFIDHRDKAVEYGLLDPASDEILTEKWARIILHLPYAFQGKRMFPDVYRFDRRGRPEGEALMAEIGPEPLRVPGESDQEFERASDDYRRAISNTEGFKTFVADKIERGQRASSLIGNQYTGSIFLALMSTLEADLAEGNDLTGKTLGLCGYGSGAKAKVFSGVVQPAWRAVVERFQLFERLEARRALTADEYEALHDGQQPGSVLTPEQEFVLVGVQRDGELAGTRSYAWVGV